MNINWKQAGIWAGAGGLLAIVSNLILAPKKVDWVNVALVPELAEEIGTDLPTRIELAQVGYSALDSAKGPPGTPLNAGNAADTYGRSTLERHGQRAFDLLTVEQRKEFYRMFKAREVVPVKYSTRPNPEAGGPAIFTVNFGWKNAPRSTVDSLNETEELLRRAWQMIPSRDSAESLLDHDNLLVVNAAKRWLRENAPEGEQAEPDRRDGGEHFAEIRRRHEKIAADLERRRKELAGQNTASDKPDPSPTTSSPQAADDWNRQAQTEPADRNIDLERQVADALRANELEEERRRAEFEQSAADMRRAHEAKATDMRRDHDTRRTSGR